MLASSRTWTQRQDAPVRDGRAELGARDPVPRASSRRLAARGAQRRVGRVPPDEDVPEAVALVGSGLRLRRGGQRDRVPRQTTTGAGANPLQGRRQRQGKTVPSAKNRTY